MPPRPFTLKVYHADPSLSPDQRSKSGFIPEHKSSSLDGSVPESAIRGPVLPSRQPPSSVVPQDEPQSAGAPSHDAPEEDNSLVTKAVPNNEPAGSTDPARENKPSKNAHDHGFQGSDKASSKHQSQNSPSSIGNGVIPPSRQASVQPPGINNQEPALASQGRASSARNQGLNGILNSVFGYAPDSVAIPVTGPANLLATDPESVRPETTGPVAPNTLSIIVNGVTTSLLPDHSTTLRSSVVIGSQTVTSGDSAITVFSDSISSPASIATDIGSNADMLSHPGAIPPPIYTVGGEIFAANPTETPIQGSIVRVGDSAATVAGTPASLQSSGALVIGGSTVLVVPEVATLVSEAAAGDQTLAASPPTISVAGTSISAGAKGITIAGTEISLEPSGGLIIGDNTIPMSSTDWASASIFVSGQTSVHTISGKTLTAASDAISVAGSKITPGGPAITPEGTPMSLQVLGYLPIGHSIISISPTATNSVPASTISGQPSPTASATMLGTLLVSAGSELTIGGTLISIQASGTPTSSDSAAAMSSGNQSAQTLHTTSEGHAESRTAGVLWSAVAAVVAILFLSEYI